MGLFRLSKRARKNPNTLLRHNLRSESQLAHFGLLLDYLLSASSVTKTSAHTTGRPYRTLSDSRKYCVNSSWYASAEYTRYLPSEISQAGGVHHLVLTGLVFLQLPGCENGLGCLSFSITTHHDNRDVTSSGFWNSSRRD